MHHRQWMQRKPSPGRWKIRHNLEKKFCKCTPRTTEMKCTCTVWRVQGWCACVPKRIKSNTVQRWSAGDTALRESSASRLLCPWHTDQKTGTSFWYVCHKLFKLFVIMTWKDDQIEKLILFYSYNSLFLVPDFWYQKSCNWYQKLAPDSGTSFWSVCHGHYIGRHTATAGGAAAAETLRLTQGGRMGN